jgi:hypothetical protein
VSDVQVPFGDDQQETAMLLLAAAEDLGLDASVVSVNSDGGFNAPEEVAKKAKAETASDDADDAEEKKPAKKAAAKRSASK